MSKTYVNLSYQADISDLKRQLEKIPGITEKEAMSAVKQLNSSFKKAESQAKKMNDEMKGSKARLSDIKKGAAAAFGGGINDIEDYIGALGSMGPVALGVVASLAAITAGVTLAVGALYGVVEATRAGESAMKRLQEVSNLELVSEEDAKNIKEANAALNAFGLVADEVTVALASGLAPAVKQGSMLLLDMIFAAEDLWDSLNEGKVTLMSYGKAVMEHLVDTMLVPITMSQHLIQMQADLATALGFTGTAIQKLAEKYGDDHLLQDYIKTSLEAIATTTEHDERTKALVGAKKKDAKASKEQADAEKERLAKLEKIKDLQETLKAQSDAAISSTKSESDQVKDSSKVKIKAIYDQLDALEKLGETQAGIDKASIVAAQTVGAIKKKESQDLLAIKDKEAKELADFVDFVDRRREDAYDKEKGRTKDLLNEIVDFVQQVSDAYAAVADIVNSQNDIAGDHHKKKLERIRDEKKQTTKSYKDALKDYKAHEAKMTDREREAALASLAVLKAGTKAKIDSLNGEAAAEKAALMKAWKTKKALAYGQIAINTALAITSAIAQFGPPPNPVAIAAMVAATAIGVGSAIAVASEPTPKFHTGRSPQELPAVLDRGEAVLNRRGAHTMGKEAIDAANNGTSAPMIGGMGDVVIALNSRVIDTLSSEAVRRGPKTRLMIRQFQKQSSGRGGYR